MGCTPLARSKVPFLIPCVCLFVNTTQIYCNALFLGLVQFCEVYCNARASDSWQIRVCGQSIAKLYNEEEKNQLFSTDFAIHL